MHWIDITIFFVYIIAMLGIGVYFFRKNNSTDDFYVGGRQMSSTHVGLSVVATDVGGGFSIGLGGLGFTMGIAGSWMLFTGLLGAWISAVLLVPRVNRLSSKMKFLTFPQMFGHYYTGQVALVAAIISAIGYLGFTSSQILAGAKLASATFIDLDLQTALIAMGVIAVIYTVLGGMKAVIYTDTVQWIILMAGLIFIGIPLGYKSIGGLSVMKDFLPPEMFSLSNISWKDMVNWGITIIPIWFVGMTLYQRIYSCKNEKEAQKAWFIAGLFEWPIMAFMGVLLGLFARVAFLQGDFAADGFPATGPIDNEMGLPLLLKNVLPIGLLGLMMSAYFSAIMSTADSCLMAASGNIVTDILERISKNWGVSELRLSQISTLVIGALALLLATQMKDVLKLMLYSYSFMVSGLLVPVLGILVFKKPNPNGALWAMIVGGSVTTILKYLESIKQTQLNNPDFTFLYGLDANFVGIGMGMLIYLFFQFRQKSTPTLN